MTPESAERQYILYEWITNSFVDKHGDFVTEKASEASRYFSDEALKAIENKGSTITLIEW